MIIPLTVDLGWLRVPFLTVNRNPILSFLIRNQVFDLIDSTFVNLGARNKHLIVNPILLTADSFLTCDSILKI
jgi:hypothetical protein